MTPLLPFGYRYLLITSFFLVSNFGYSQNRSNPFEVKQRMTLLTKIDTSSLASNTIDTAAGLFQKDTANMNGGVNNSGNLSSDSLRRAVLLSDNPFEVDHVPVRRSQFEKRKESIETSISSTQASNGFLIGFLLLACALLGIVINTRSKNLSFIPQTLYNENMLKLVHREESNKFSSFFIFLYTIFVINLSTSIYLINGHYGGPKGIKVFLLIMAGTIVVYMVRHISLSLVGNLFDVSKNTNLYSFTIMIFNAFTGLCLLPINFVMAFSPESVKGPTIIFALVLIGILLLLRHLRGLLIASEFIFNRLFQFIIYLCGFELAPILIGIKFLMKYGGV